MRWFVQHFHLRLLRFGELAIEVAHAALVEPHAAHVRLGGEMGQGGACPSVPTMREKARGAGMEQSGRMGKMGGTKEREGVAAETGGGSEGGKQEGGGVTARW